MISTQSCKSIQNLLIVKVKASSPFEENIDIRDISSEMGVELTNTINLFQAIKVGQSVLSPAEGGENEEVV